MDVTDIQYNNAMDSILNAEPTYPVLEYDKFMREFAKALYSPGANRYEYLKAIGFKVYLPVVLIRNGAKVDEVPPLMRQLNLRDGDDSKVSLATLVSRANQEFNYHAARGEAFFNNVLEPTVMTDVTRDTDESGTKDELYHLWSEFWKRIGFEQGSVTKSNSAPSNAHEVFDDDDVVPI